MKSLFVMIGAFCCASSIAQSNDAIEKCEDYSRIAGSIMESRQSGEKMSALMKVAAEMGAISDALKLLVIKAYQEPQFRTQPNRAQAATEFENGAYLECITRANERNK